ncbi:hypothetical protein Ddc_14148 [Ditylenchus destructor]|nr:hypothetical protein Ddc_14148 [Ditylenchus destructor]
MQSSKIAQSTVSYISTTTTEKSVKQLNFGSDYVTPHLRCMAITTSALKKTPTYFSRKKLLAGAVTMGTPRQGPFWIMFDLFRGNNLAVLYLFDKYNNSNQPVYDPTWNPIKNAEITIGELDTENCVDNWAFAPRLYDSSIPEGYLIFLDSITMDFNGTMATVDIRKRVLLEYWEGDLNKTGEVPYHLKFFFVYAAGAIYNMSSHNYEVDCALADAGNVILNFGDPNIANQEPQIQLVIRPRDYIYYETELKKCIVAFEGYAEETSTVNQTIKLPLAFWNNHCFAYNLETEEVGFADSKVQNNNLAEAFIL